MLETNDAVIRLFVSLFAGLIIGFTRRKYPAGIRTFTLICLGSTIFTFISIDPALINGAAENIDPTRVISQIVTGIGFIGAGVIWKSQAKLGGLTTAAAIWTTAAVGVLIGIGEMFLATVSLLMVVAVIWSKHIFPNI